jgi:hypothetical protein
MKNRDYRNQHVLYDLLSGDGSYTIVENRAITKSIDVYMASTNLRICLIEVLNARDCIEAVLDSLPFSKKCVTSLQTPTSKTTLTLSTHIQYVSIDISTQ